ncbi:outer membrane protein assembly factor BamE [Bordetella genomosp. 9]|uniref:Cell envelope protein SmpA n=1 Tax=Bordetella genomosp. 9 TaxID=1416803 RepID=A0A1W6Z1I7_9BORD|nr:outer membrane protein assembly factor BamE [Bordetella genomosp. 9]ARP86693.1 cell envelope protein SmpA [Bordetella genomosp. 9]ARP90685.1 cell envelope protein SmpA [Bordetella genomosp. 9]
MQKRFKQLPLACAGIVLGLTLAGCGNLSKIDSQGRSASPVWPDLSMAMQPKGSYPDLYHLSMVKAGMNKDQLYELIGRPHFQEGFYVREWDYLFHIPTAEGETLCQYKILFDRHRTARTLLWRTPACEEAAKLAMRNVKKPS